MSVNAGPGNAGPGSIGSENVEPENVGSENIGPGNTGPGNVGSGNVRPENVGSGNVGIRLVGVLAGLVTGLLELCLLTLAWPARARWGPAVLRAERRRLAWLGQRTDERPPVYRYLAVRALLGVTGGYAVLALAFVSVLFLGGSVWAMATGDSQVVSLAYPGVRLETGSGAIGLSLGLVLLALTAAAVELVAWAERRLAVRHLGPGTQELMRRRIAELTDTRLGIVRAVDDERRRIERDLHDGVQQRGVALAMLLGRARHSPEAAPELVEQAYAESRRLLDELRSVAWRVYPTALDELGLRAALDGVAERAGVPVQVRYGLRERPVSEVETALYFVAREAITNAVKHSGARDILVDLREEEGTVVMTVSDDGRGGADPAGGGLSGLARRVRALDGSFEVRSGADGTTVRAALPCG